MRASTLVHRACSRVSFRFASRTRKQRQIGHGDSASILLVPDDVLRRIVLWDEIILRGRGSRIFVRTRCSKTYPNILTLALSRTAKSCSSFSWLSILLQAPSPIAGANIATIYPVGSVIEEFLGNLFFARKSFCPLVDTEEEVEGGGEEEGEGGRKGVRRGGR